MDTRQLKKNTEDLVKLGVKAQTLKVKYRYVGKAEPRLQGPIDDEPPLGWRCPVCVSMNAISAWQTDQMLHELTCGNDSNHTILFPAIVGGKVVLVCRDCDYLQKNIPDVVLNHAPPEADDVADDYYETVPLIPLEAYDGNALENS